MTKKELIKRLENFPDDAEIRINERGSCYDWTPVNAYYRDDENRVYIRNFTNKQVKKSVWPS